MKKILMKKIEGWWKELKFEGTAGFAFHNKLKALKAHIKVWVANNLHSVEKRIESLEGVLQFLVLQKGERDLSFF